LPRRFASATGYQRDWPVVLAADCIGSRDHEPQEISLGCRKDKIASVMSNAKVVAALKG